MKQLKKIVSIAVVFAMLLASSVLFTACTKTEQNTEPNTGNTGNESNNGGANNNAGDTFEIALITDKGNIDDKSFNQGAWEGVVEFAEANNITHKYYKPEEASDAGYLASIQLAIKGGAKVVVTPGYLFEVAVYEAQTQYPDVKFILLDGAPHTADYSTFETKDNVASVMYAK